MDMLIRRLLSQAYLFDDPSAYEAGVRDALDLLDRELRPEGREAHRFGVAAAVEERVAV